MKPRCFFKSLFVCLAVLTGVAVVPAVAQVNFKTRQWSLQLDNSGKLTSMKSLALQKEFLYTDKATALMSIKKDGAILPSQSCTWNPKKSELVLSYPQAGVTATVKVQRNDSYISFELINLAPAEHIDLVLWGPYPTTIADTVGEVVGVVRNKEFAIGIQALNIKTLGGYPNAESDVEPSYDIFESGHRLDVTADDMNKQLFRGDVARPTEYGASLQAYCRNRDKDRVIENWGHAAYLAPAFKDGGVVGSKIALFGVSNAEVLPTISQIELKEGLPHPLLDGEWGKQASHASESYLIMDFGVDNLPAAIAATKQAGLRYLYHGDPFDTWGHFKLHAKEFPQNWASMKQCVETAKAAGVRLGVHTLSNFITTNDPYVTPVPDPRLGKVGYSTLSQAIDANAKEIGIEDPVFFNQFQNNTLKSVVIGNEIIRYGSVSAAAPWKLLDCQRGAFGTHAAAHQQNDSIGKLMDHAYKVFLTDYALQEEMATTIANLFNETGLMQISFDGLEGCLSSGMGQYARQLFTKTWYDHLKPELKGKVINDASTPGHYFWHIYTRMNWGEPWYAGFRESQLQLRLKNQQFFRRNLMPSMLGWFSLRPETTPEDIEWMLAMAAGYNAGFGLSTSLETLQKHGKKDEVLGLIKTWEQARMQHIFSEAQQAQMRSLKHEFHLEMTGTNEYRLTPVYNAYFKHSQQMKQPGEPVFSTFQFNNPAASQPVSFIISLAGGKDFDPDVTFDQISIAINHQDALVLPVSLKRNQFLKCDGKVVKLYNKQWQLIQTVELSKPLPVLSSNANEIVFDGKYSGENGADVKLEVRASGAPEIIHAGR
ncbi:hypothetical protein FHW36_103448 [Chitinophaga polysaccharea]|uniref:Uncharacterized protein n=1 Tax=Chitinophaga polysaccharea TaxID=1293035 RepID=A0A561PU49_9BACT|nr:hypothetical protein [Chitinophaga polysaccharea]TWF41644.1 hypothetical protein FHW36_103448 [Chitinophaga polysaccharea]